MEKIEREMQDLQEKITFCNLLLQYGNLVGATNEQNIKAFKLRGEFEEELRVIKVREGL